MAFLFLCYFPDEIAFSSILRNELKRFASGAILSFAEKPSQLASNFKLTRTPTIYGEHVINREYFMASAGVRYLRASC